MASNVISGQNADVLVVPAAMDDGLSLFVVDRRQGAPVEVTPLESLDPTRRQANIRLEQCPARLVGPRGGAPAALEQALALVHWQWPLRRSAEAGRVLETAVEHAISRVQFGRSIGSFQAIKHRCADMKVLLEGSRAAVMGAAEVLAGADKAESGGVAGQGLRQQRLLPVSCRQPPNTRGDRMHLGSPGPSVSEAGKGTPASVGIAVEHQALIAQGIGLRPASIHLTADLLEPEVLPPPVDGLQRGAGAVGASPLLVQIGLVVAPNQVRKERVGHLAEHVPFREAHHVPEHLNGLPADHQAIR